MNKTPCISCENLSKCYICKNCRSEFKGIQHFKYYTVKLPKKEGMINVKL